MKNKIISGQVIPINQANIDTDAIIPKQYLKSINKSGFGKFLFDSLRYSRPGTLDDYEDRELNMDFVLNKEPFSKGKILIANDNFGCGSSREHAVWAIKDFGIEAIISTSFADIFSRNSFKNGILLISVNKEILEKLFKDQVDGYISRNPKDDFVFGHHGTISQAQNPNEDMKTKQEPENLGSPCM